MRVFGFVRTPHRRALAVDSLLWLGLLIACGGGACRGGEPGWTRQPVASVAGEPTITGEPARLQRFTAAPTIDGRLDDVGWWAATALGPFVEPGEGAAARPDDPVYAFARAGWDDAHLYLGFVVRDGAPVAPFARDADDPHVWGASSAVEIMLQPGDPGDNRDYYEIQIDTRGAVFDSHFDDYNSPVTGAGSDKRFGHQEWSSHVERASFIAAGRLYAIEAAIPWSAFTSARTPIPPRPGDVWRLELYSFRDGQRRALAWSPIRHAGNFHKSARFGRIRFD